MKLFILEINKGQYDDAVNWTEGVFSKIEKLEEYKKKFIENNEKVKQLPCPIDIEIYNQNEWYNKVSDEEWECVS